MVLKLHTLIRLIYGGKVVVNTWHPNWEKKNLNLSIFFLFDEKNWADLGGDCSEYYSMIVTQNSSINDNPKRPAGGDAREAHIPSYTQLAAL